MDDEHELIDDDLDYILLFDENNEKKQNGKTGCCLILFFLFSSVTIGYIELSEFFV